MAGDHDDALSSLLEDARGDGRSFLLACFDFAARKTDFFKQRDAAEQLTALINDVCLEHSIVKNDDDEGDDRDSDQSSSSSSSDDDEDDDDDSMTSSVPATPALYDETTIEEVVEDVQEKTKTVDEEEKGDGGNGNGDDDVDSEKKKKNDAADNNDDDTTTTTSPPPRFRRPNAGNGLDLDTYSWTQTLAEVVICVPLVKGTKAKDCEVKIAKDSLRVAVRGGAAGGASSSSPFPSPSPSLSPSSSFVAILDGPLEASVKPGECFWNVLDGQTLEITLTKADGMRWWSRVVVGGGGGKGAGGEGGGEDGEARIDTSRVEPENSKLGDLDSETRATVEKMMWDQRQKALGLPTSEEARRAEILERFKAQHPELDFSQARIG